MLARDELTAWIEDLRGRLERGEVIHVLGTYAVLERALKRFPLREPFDLVDAAFWAWHDVAFNVLASAFDRVQTRQPPLPPPPTDPFLIKVRRQGPGRAHRAWGRR